MLTSNSEAAAAQKRRMGIVARANAHGYERSKHQEEDKKPGINKHCSQTISLNKRVLDVYATYVLLAFTCFLMLTSWDSWRWSIQDELTENDQSHLCWKTVYHEFLCKGAPASRMEDVKDFLCSTSGRAKNGLEMQIKGS